MDRRTFLSRSIGVSVFAGAAAAGLPLALRDSAFNDAPLRDELAPSPPAAGIIPVVGDGKYVWNKPPENQTGYLEPRQFELSVGIELVGEGNATNIRATTVAPVEQPEQRIENVRVEQQGCRAGLRQLAPDAGQLMLAAPGIVKGQRIGAVAHYRLTLYKSYQGYQKQQFPAEQEFAKDFRKLYMYDSPGIQTRRKEVRKLAAQLADQQDHPWDIALACYDWVWKNIRARTGPYTSVIEALRDRVGDCEERAAVFVALCRASSIPSRLVWVPNHNWAEIFLNDHEGKGHWIPVHTSAYSWFGWTGAHEIVLQKGDSISVPEKSKEQRLLADWMQWQGAKPKARWFARLRPLPGEEAKDAGPGSRDKDERGEWRPVGNHPLDKRLRDGERMVEAE